jgi:hypothetical protein
VSTGLAGRGGLYLESVVKVADFTKTVQKLVDSCLVVFHKWIEGCHVSFFGVGRFVCQVLKHLRDLHTTSTDQPSPDRRSVPRTRVNVRLGCFAGTPSTNIYACGVTTAGLIKRRKKNPPISEQIAMSVASGYFLYRPHIKRNPIQEIDERTRVRLRICLHIQRIP